MERKTSTMHHGYQYRGWRKHVLRNGNHRCSICGGTEDLTADHIKPVATYPELAYDVPNGRILCNKCRVRDMLEGIQMNRFKRK